MYGNILFDGLEYIESLAEINKNSKNIFIAFHFTNELQKIFDNEIKSAIEELGFNYVRVSSSITDTDTHINDDIIGKIKSAKMVIADFSGQRNSVYFEAGFAMGLKIPVIWSCKEAEVNNLSFDTRQYPHILWSNKNEFVEKLIQRIKTLI
jgi:nucleoside 2-deoxyribosyltransferase